MSSTSIDWVYCLLLFATGLYSHTYGTQLHMTLTCLLFIELLPYLVPLSWMQNKKLTYEFRLTPHNCWRRLCCNHCLSVCLSEKRRLRSIFFVSRFSWIPSLCSASYVGSQRAAARICCWASCCGVVLRAQQAPLLLSAGAWLCNERKVSGRGVGSGCGVTRRRRWFAVMC